MNTFLPILILAIFIAILVIFVTALLGSYSVKRKLMYAVGSFIFVGVMGGSLFTITISKLISAFSPKIVVPDYWEWVAVLFFGVLGIWEGLRLARPGGEKGIQSFEYKIATLIASTGIWKLIFGDRTLDESGKAIYSKNPGTSWGKVIIIWFLINTAVRIFYPNTAIVYTVHFVTYTFIVFVGLPFAIDRTNKNISLQKSDSKIEVK